MDCYDLKGNAMYEALLYSKVWTAPLENKSKLECKHVSHEHSASLPKNILYTYMYVRVTLKVTKRYLLVQFL